MSKYPDEALEVLSEIYRLFGNVPRLKILLRLNQGEATAGELTEAAGLSQSATSHQLRDLKQARIIKSRKAGLYVFYSLADNHIVGILQTGLDHLSEVDNG